MTDGMIPVEEALGAKEREVLFRLIYGYETIDFAESQNFTTRDCYGVVDRILEAGFRMDDPLLDQEWEYAIANYGDLDDIISEPSVDRSTMGWARGALMPEYGDLIVRRKVAGPWESFDQA